jgi:hypothetical protein
MQAGFTFEDNTKQSFGIPTQNSKKKILLLLPRHQ